MQGATSRDHSILEFVGMRARRSAAGVVFAGRTFVSYIGCTARKRFAGVPPGGLELRPLFNGLRHRAARTPVVEYAATQTPPSHFPHVDTDVRLQY
jgi:hypothetical protein